MSMRLKLGAHCGGLTLPAEDPTELCDSTLSCGVRKTLCARISHLFGNENVSLSAARLCISLRLAELDKGGGGWDCN